MLPIITIGEQAVQRLNAYVVGVSWLKWERKPRIWCGTSPNDDSSVRSADWDALKSFILRMSESE